MKEKTRAGLYCSDNKWATDFVKQLDTRYPGIYDLIMQTSTMIGVTDIHPKDDGRLLTCKDGSHEALVMLFLPFCGSL